ncbi:hypothetical protein [Streptomyces pinistramenti]|uniref:hypothetical protein n=1 Tax=Streptomyces pinistramenti TaxID=2884812 RepID=UPI001D08FCE2|nr:hypothetical protein [Streptomyces pinistramenti]MCB5909249.1 hypothetical protein [Streptomyces pinistramenti]
MIVILGLILLVAAIVVGVAAIITNVGAAHELTQAFKVFGYHATGTTGALFLFGVIVGAVAILGLSMLLAGMHRTPRRERHIARRGLAEPRQEPAAVRRDDEAPPVEARHHRRPHLFGHRAAHR